jgi:hypothetical protein
MRVAVGAPLLHAIAAGVELPEVDAAPPVEALLPLVPPVEEVPEPVAVPAATAPLDPPPPGAVVFGGVVPGFCDPVDRPPEVAELLLASALPPVAEAPVEPVLPLAETGLPP